jgi:hypothetical protein
VKAGDKVRLIGIPPDAKDDKNLQTRMLFEACLGKVFTIEEVIPTEDYEPMFELKVGHVLGKPTHEHKIWVESRYLEKVNSNSD